VAMSCLVVRMLDRMVTPPASRRLRPSALRQADFPGVPSFGARSPGRSAPWTPGAPSVLGFPKRTRGCSLATTPRAQAYLGVSPPKVTEPTAAPAPEARALETTQGES
jgi:hypothetical protein